MSKFQQRHYEAIAEVMQDARRRTTGYEGNETIIGKVIDELVDLFRYDNYLFQPERFRQACVPGANVKARTR